MREDQRFSKATDELREQLYKWRKSHRPPTPLPQELWDRAAELATELGLWKTARALRLDYAALKRRIDTRISKRPLSPVPQFVELFAPLSGQIAECILDVESVRGARLRVEMKNVAASGLASIIREFAG